MGLYQGYRIHKLLDADDVQKDTKMVSFAHLEAHVQANVRANVNAWAMRFNAIAHSYWSSLPVQILSCFASFKFSGAIYFLTRIYL